MTPPFLRHLSLSFCDSTVSLSIPCQARCCLPPLLPSDSQIPGSFICCFYPFHPLQAGPLVKPRSPYCPVYWGSLLHCLTSTLNPMSKAELCPLLPPQMAAPQSSPPKTEPHSSLTRPAHPHHKTRLTSAAATLKHTLNQCTLPASTATLSPTWRTI